MVEKPVTKAVILARGLGKRMRAADADTHLDAAQAKVAQAGVKGMIDVGRPFLDYVISALADAGITDVCLVIGPEHDLIRDHYGAPGLTSRVRIHFAVQAEPLGTANAIAAARDFAGEDRFVVLNSDNYYRANGLRVLAACPGNAALGYDRQALTELSNIPAQRIAAFAIMLTQGARLRGIVEKPDSQTLAEHPQAPISMNAWLFGPEIFTACDSISPSVRGEYEVTDAVRFLIDAGYNVHVAPLAEGVLDMSTRGDVAAVKAALAGIEVEL